LARRADHTKEELVAMTIDAARQLIAGEGIENFSARALSRAIGYAPGTLYHHFRDLDDIVTEVNGLTIAGVADAFAKARRSSDPKKMLHNYADAFVGYIFDNPKLWEALFEFKRAAGVEIPAWYRDSIEGLAQTIAPCFSRLRSDASEAEALEAAKLIFASIHSVISLQNSRRVALLLDRDARSIVHELVDIHITAFIHR
jgi:AcrR family transcriptional regulator